MARNPEKERIFAAWWEFYYSPPQERAKAEAAFNEALDTIVAKSGGAFTRSQVESFLVTEFTEYRTERIRREAIAMQASSMKPTGSSAP